MLKKLSGFLLAGALLLPLAACGTAGGTASAPQSPSQDAPVVPASPAPPETSATSVEPSTEPPAVPSQAPSLSPEPEGYDLPDRDYQPWQEAYMGFLAELRAQEWADESAYAALDESERETEEGAALWGAISDVSESSYSLYDVDKDGVPELFVKLGDCEAAYHTRCYTFRDGEMALAGEFGSGHSGLYTCPDRSAFLVHRAHMGYAQLVEYSMEDGTLAEGRELLDEEEALEYTDPSEIVPGAEGIDSFFTKRGEYSPYPEDRPQPSAGKALLLPVCDWQAGPAPTGQSSETARAAILAALNGETELYGASGDHFDGDTGQTTWEAYIQPGAAYPYGDTPLQIVQHVWLDLNGDGQEECVLRLRSDSGTAVVVLSEQKDAVYAYYFAYYDGAEFCADGTILNPYGGTNRLSFWKGQCYQYTVSAADARSVEWTEGAPGA